MDNLTSMDLQAMSTSLRPYMEWRLCVLVNLTFYYTKLKGIRCVGRGEGTRLPLHMRHCKSVIGLIADQRMAIAYDDGLCAFRCLGLLENCRCASEVDCACKKPLEHLVVKLYAAYCPNTGVLTATHEFPGICLDNLATIE